MAAITDDRERIGKAIYLKWCENNAPLGPWESLADWKRENFRRLADAAYDALVQLTRERLREQATSLRKVG